MLILNCLIGNIKCVSYLNKFFIVFEMHVFMLKNHIRAINIFKVETFRKRTMINSF